MTRSRKTKRRKPARAKPQPDVARVRKSATVYRMPAYLINVGLAAGATIGLAVALLA